MFDNISQRRPRTDLWEVLLVDVDGIIALNHVLDKTCELDNRLDVVLVLLDLRSMYNAVSWTALSPLWCGSRPWHRRSLYSETMKLSTHLLAVACSRACL